MSMVFDNGIMTQAVTDFNNRAADLKKAGQALIDALNKDLATFEGKSKEALLELIGNESKEGSLAFFVLTQVPKVLENAATLLDANRTQIQDGDSQLAQQLNSN